MILYPNSYLSSHKTKQIWGQLSGSALSLALAEYCQNTPGLKLIVTEDNLSAAQIMAELKFFLGEEAKEDFLYFPDWETLPYDQFSPHQDLISQRLLTLYKLMQKPNALLISSVATLMHKLSPPEFLASHALVLHLGQVLNFDDFRHLLQKAGYRAVSKVLEHGEYALRGSIMDVFPMGSKEPLRIELFDETIESLRHFDVETQRTTKNIEKLCILPAREMGLDEGSISLFRRQFRQEFSGNPSLCPLYEAVSEGLYPAGIEYYLPLFFSQSASIFDYLSDKSSLCLVGEISDFAEKFWQEVALRYEQRSSDITRPILKPERCFLRPSDFLQKVNEGQNLRLYPEFKDKALYNFPCEKAPDLPIVRHAEQPLSALVAYLNQEDCRYLIVVESAGRREVLLDMLKKSGLTAVNQASWAAFLASSSQVNICIGPLILGVECSAAKIAIIVESQLFGSQGIPQGRKYKKALDPELIIRDLTELQIHAPVVHVDFGVGRYLGLKTIEHDGLANEFLILAYADEAKIYVPVTSLHCISRYSGLDPDKAPLHKLGTDRWQKEKKKALEKIHDVAIELLEIYAKREARPGFIYKFPQEAYQEFSLSFPFNETEDQLQAIEEIIQDMKAPRPMDRLICGDVGFGKTEVAMRAAFLAVQNGKQVCVLVPTTLLAGQHFENFRDRFADIPLHIDLLSRFRTAKESKDLMQALKQGQVDIVIGTHKLFSKDLAFKNLGLLIIDEEHRFGVKQKEHIKALRLNVDILSMTATPIPRTLNMAMAGLRDISLIATPPAKRLAIKTFWQEKNTSILREAMLREILRGGQVFFLHNDVQSIAKVADEMQALVPEAKIKIAHGQMRERELEKIMADFYHHRFNVLVCTTIIETGIDIPTANTIIIDRADKFGLAQLHQLRGRVGRSHHQAYAYLLTPNQKIMTSDAVKRLEAIVSLEDLGAGFSLATHDLELRGAGELLGEEQSGNMQALGYNLYMELLDKAVKDLKAGLTPELAAPIHQGPDMDLRLSAILPESYIQDIHTRLILYKRIANAKTKEALNELQVEMIDRFGLLPQEAKQLLWVTELKLLAAELGVTKISLHKEQGKLDFSPKARIDAQVLITLIQVHAKRYQMQGPQRLIFNLSSLETEEKIFEIKELLKKLKLKD